VPPVLKPYIPGGVPVQLGDRQRLPGAPALIVVDSGDQQVGIPGQPVAPPLVAAVTDSGYNRLGGVQVQFTTSKGRGSFAGPYVATSTNGQGQGVNGAIGQLTDDNKIYPAISKPYVNASFVVAQRFAYFCLCSNQPGTIKTLTGPISITRSVSPNADGTWKACITKSGITDCIILP
jgi:hypothetical protein